MDKKVENLTGGLILNALSSSGSTGQTLLQQIDAMTTLTGGIICTGYIYKIKYGHIINLLPYNIGRSTVQDDDVFYINQIWQPYEWYFCVYNSSDVIQYAAPLLDMGIQREQSEWAIENYVDTYSGGYIILPDDEWHCDSITVNTCTLVSSGGWSDYKLQLNLDITYNGTYTDHNWTSQGGGQYIDNPTTSPYTRNSSVSYVRVVPQGNPVYTDMTDAVFQTFICNLAQQIHDYLNT